MKKRITQIVSLVIMALLVITCTGNKLKHKIPSLASDGEGESEWISLFNSKNLDGWSVQCTPKDQGNNFWTVESGTILCNSLGSVDHNYIWLISDGEYENFELRLRFQA